MPTHQSKTCPVPIMTLVGIEGTHAWLDERMTVVGYGPIRTDSEFHKSRLLLSQIVNAVIQHFQLNPPSNLRIVDPSLQRMQPFSAGGGNGNGSSPASSNVSAVAAAAASSYQRYPNGNATTSSSSHNAYTPPPPKKDVTELHFSDVITIDGNDQQQVQKLMDNYFLPNTPNVIPELESITETNEIMNLLTDTNQLLPKLEQNLMVVRTEERKNTILSSNHVTATTNLAKKNELQNLHEEVTDLQSKLREKVDRLNQLKTRQVELCKPLSNDKVLKKLKKAKKQSMNESDDLAYNWLDKTKIRSNNEGDGGDEANQLDLFFNDFLEKRIVHHVRAAKIERIENS